MAFDQEFLQEMRKRLEEEKERLEKELSRFARPTGREGEYESVFEDLGRDKDDNAHEVEMYQDKLALEQTLEKRLKEVQEALDRLEQGTYGICQKCGKEIEKERLQAYPEARYCASCAASEGA